MYGAGSQTCGNASPHSRKAACDAGSISAILRCKAIAVPIGRKSLVAGCREGRACRDRRREVVGRGIPAEPPFLRSLSPLFS